MPTVTVVRNVERRWKQMRWELKCNGSIDLNGGFQDFAVFRRDLFIKSRSWDRTPNYFLLKRQKKHLPDNNFSFVEERNGDEDLVFNAITINQPCTQQDGSITVREMRQQIPASMWTPDRGNRILTSDATMAKLVERAKGAEWSVPTFVGEGREAVGMVVDAARTLASGYRNLRRGNFTDFLRTFGLPRDSAEERRYNRRFGRDPQRTAHGYWLEYTYGWTPLVGDVYNAAHTLSETVNKEANREIRVTARTRREDREVTPNQAMSTTPPITARKTVVTKEESRGVWRCKPTSLDTLGSFGVLNPALVAWELLPFSFVVDWFLPVGRYLEGLDVPMRFTHLGGTLGYRRVVHVEYDRFVYEGFPQQGTHSTNYVIVTRDKLTGPPVLAPSSIVFEPNLGIPRLISALALMRGTFSR